MPVPSHADWKAFKKKLGIPDGAVSGINMGKLLDGYDKALNARDQAKMASAAQALSEGLSKYAKKLPENKLSQPNLKKFKTEFKSEYVDATEKALDEALQKSGDLAAFGRRAQSFVGDALKLKKGAPRSDLDQFKSGPLRGFSTLGKVVKGYDAKPLMAKWAKIGELLEAMEGNDEMDGGAVKNATQEYRDKVVEIIHSLAGDTAKTLAKDGVITKA